jgi:hypothetical protein
MESSGGSPARVALYVILKISALLEAGGLVMSFSLDCRPQGNRAAEAGTVDELVWTGLPPVWLNNSEFSTGLHIRYSMPGEEKTWKTLLSEPPEIS